MQHIEKFENGLTVIVEEMSHVQSVAYELQIPGGIAHDSEDRIGASLILAELTSRGAKGLSSRQLCEAFEEHGIRHGENAGFDRYFFRGSLFGSKLNQALELVAAMVLQPTLPEEEIENIRSPILQDIAALSDNPSRRAFVELNQRYYPGVYGRPGHGSESGLKATNLDTLQSLWKGQFRPNGSLLSIAGGIKTADALEIARRHFSNWNGIGLPQPTYGSATAPAVHHIQSESAQLQIVMAYPSAKFGDIHYYPTKIAAGILSGGMFGRLFIEVREKRGLCYSVYARHSGNEKYGTVQVYAGTTPERAHETLLVMVEELHKLAGSLTEQEVKRAKANLKASMVIGEESSSSRASSNAGDYWILNRVRSLDEIMAAVDKVSISDIDSALNAHPAKGVTLLTLGNRDLADIYREKL